MSGEDIAAKSAGDQERTVDQVGEEILAALAMVAQAAQRALSEARAGVSPGALVNRSNMMVGAGRAERFIESLNESARENLLRLLREPFMARVDVDWGEGASESVQTYYFSRPSVAGLRGAIEGAQLVTSAAVLGRLAEHEAGESAVVGKREGRILKRTVFRPTQQQGLWDVLVKRFEAMPWGDLLEMFRQESLREALKGIRVRWAGPLPDEDILGRLMQEAADAALERHRIRRKVVDRIALRDQPILDKFQGEIFRLPLDRQVILFGPPGSGKTTTLIKRLAQKRTPNALSEEEETILSGSTRDNFLRQDSWAMFSPSELLKIYLGAAFNQEGVPDAANLRMWDKERRELARNVFGILRSTSSGRFQLEANPTLLADGSSSGIANLHDEFAAHVEKSLLTRCNDALTRLLESKDQKVLKEVARFQRTLNSTEGVELPDVLRLFDQAEGLQSEIKRLTDLISDDLKRIVNQLLNRNRTLLDEIVEALPTLRAEEEEDADEEIDETPETSSATASARVEALNILMSALRNWARAIAEGRRTISGQSGRVIEFARRKLPPEDEFVNVGASIATRSHLRTLVQAPRNFVMGIPAIYGRFRRLAFREGRHFVPGEITTSFLARNKISPDEVDILMLVMLQNSRRIVQSDRGRLESTTQQEWLENIKSRYLMQVFVDEATDLSAVQLACTIELANPKLRSWFACGDLRQRITANGIRNRSEIEWVNRATGIQIEIREIDVGYRQSKRLRDLADALAALNGDQAITKAPKGSEEADVWPLLREGLSEDTLAEWLAERIYEVEAAIGRLPSVAVFVDGDDLVDPLVNATRPILAKRNIQIVGCKEGRVAGDAREVRIFDVQHIKGLEFEAVFFVGIDILAGRIPDLFQRFFYVGVTRAATYLGLTCAGVLPARLEAMRSHFSTGTWA